MIAKSPRRSRSRLVCLFFAVVFALGVLGVPAVVQADESGASAESGGWWTPSYLVDYGLIAGGTAAYFIGEDLTPRTDALFGPTYDPDDPTDIFESNELNRTFVGHGRGTGETYPNTYVELTIPAVGATVAAIEGVGWARGEGSFHRLHDATVGFAEATALTATVVSLAKPFFGRLRPDFRDRALRYHCAEEADQYPDHCEGYRDRPLAEDPDTARELLEDGQKSFISGHASYSFTLFTYASLGVGGHFVWGERANTARRVGGIAAQSAMMGMAGFITGSRIADGRHHLSDLVAGTVVGAGFANLAYWRRFGLDGNLRRGDDDVETTSSELGIRPFGARPGISVTGSF